MDDAMDDLGRLIERVGAGNANHYDFGQVFSPNDVGSWSRNMAAVRTFNGSLDALANLAEHLLVGTHQITLDWGPSGSGCKVCWWPDGLSGKREILAEGHDGDPAKAGLLAVLRAYRTAEGAKP